MSVASSLFIAVVLGIMISINIQQSAEYIEYAPDFPVYRSADSTASALLKNEMIQTGVNMAKTQRSMEGTNTSLLLATIGILAGLFFNPLLLKVLAKIKELDTRNADEHKLLVDGLKIIRTESNTKQGLGEILSHQLEVAPTVISPLIAHEGKRILDFASSVMNSKFDYSIIQSSRIKLDICRSEALTEIYGFSNEFKVKFIALQSTEFDTFYGNLNDIVADQIYNSKHNRFRMITEQFLNSHLTGILNIERTLTTKI
jgi:hypothetical protein